MTRPAYVLMLAIGLATALAVSQAPLDRSTTASSVAAADEGGLSEKDFTATVADDSPVAAVVPRDEGTNASAAEPQKQLFTGQVVFLGEALKRRKVESYDEEIKDQVVLETDDGELIPIVPDWRGRAFYQDERLRNRKVELVGYRRPKVPYLEVLMVFVFDDNGERQYMDYWCDICSIPMYEIQPCICCQAPIRIRFQKKDLPDYLKRPSQ